MWIEEFGIDGLRLDAADVLSKNFLDALGSFCRSIKPDFWLMGEVVHGDYSEWIMDGRLDSVTNYQIYKALWSCLNSQNMYELAYNLNREYNGENGMYTGSVLYNFVVSMRYSCSFLSVEKKDSIFALSETVKSFL